MHAQALRSWKALSKQTILKHSKFLTVENHVVELPDGRKITDWSWVIIPDAVIVLGLSRDNKFICFRQTQYAIKGITLAPVGGMLEAGEAPLDAAKRELCEETGDEASDWIFLGSYRTEPNRVISTIHLSQ